MDVPIATEPGGHRVEQYKRCYCERAQRSNDVMIVSSFALWAMLIGLVPVAAMRLVGARHGTNAAVVNPR